MFALQALVGIIAQPFVMGVCAAGKTEMEGRIGFMVGNLVKRLCTVAWCLTAIAAVAWYAKSRRSTAPGSSPTSSTATWRGPSSRGSCRDCSASSSPPCSAA